VQFSALFAGTCVKACTTGWPQLCPGQTALSSSMKLRLVSEFDAVCFVNVPCIIAVQPTYLYDLSNTFTTLIPHLSSTSLDRLIPHGHGTVFFLVSLQRLYWLCNWILSCLIIIFVTIYFKYIPCRRNCFAYAALIFTF